MASDSLSSSDARFDWIERETLLDVLVNAVPLGILLFFSAYYTLIQPWEFDLSRFFLMHFLTLFPFAMLVLVTYVSAKVVTRDERGT